MAGGRGLIGRLLAQVLEMPYLAWAWLLALIACLLFTMLDNRKLIGVPQAIYAGLTIGVFSLQWVERGSIGYWAIWVLGGGGLATHLLIKAANQQAEDF